jgi:hypothetical protein
LSHSESLFSYSSPCPFVVLHFWQRRVLVSFKSTEVTKEALGSWTEGGGGDWCFDTWNSISCHISFAATFSSAPCLTTSKLFF